MRVLLSGEGQGLAVRCPGDRRRGPIRRRTLLKAPGPRGQSLRVPTLSAHKPNVRRSRRGSRQVVIVSNFERVIVLINLFLVGRVVAGDIGDVLSVRPPAKLFDSVGRIRDFLRVATAHWHDENLRAVFLFCSVVFLVLGVGRARQECQPVAARRPAGRAHVLAIEGQHSGGTARHVDYHQFAVSAVFFEIRTRNDTNDGLAVGRNLGIGNGHDIRQVVELDARCWAVTAPTVRRKASSIKARE
jgi:hypothetical protein